MAGTGRKVIVDHKGFEVTIPIMAGPANAVFASITEVDVNDTPFMGLAGMTIDNVVPRQGSVVVRGSIGWEANIRARIDVYAP
ncbi:hypothetical protein [Nocardia testacea]|uniref:hypothetical protein n=1 Tax=Nocardia testacea TaxID=248551 RepID=UPI003A899C80